MGVAGDQCVEAVTAAEIGQARHRCAVSFCRAEPCSASSEATRFCLCSLVPSCGHALIAPGFRHEGLSRWPASSTSATVRRRFRAGCRGVAQMEAVFTGMGLQPRERVGGFERFFGRRVARRADVQRVAAVVFAEPRCGIHLQDLCHAQAARQLPFEDAQLVGMAAEAGDRVQRNSVLCRVQLHPPPALRGATAQPQWAGEAVATGEVQQARFGFQRQAAAVCVALCIQAKLLQALLQPGQRQPLFFQPGGEGPRCRGIQQRQCFLDPGLAWQARHHGVHTLRQYRRQVAAIALAPQHPVRLRQQACIRLLRARSRWAGHSSMASVLISRGRVVASPQLTAVAPTRPPCAVHRAAPAAGPR